MRGQKGIPILVGSDINKKVSYIFVSTNLSMFQTTIINYIIRILNQ